MYSGYESVCNKTLTVKLPTRTSAFNGLRLRTPFFGYFCCSWNHRVGGRQFQNVINHFVVVFYLVNLLAVPCKLGVKLINGPRWEFEDIGRTCLEPLLKKRFPLTSTLCLQVRCNSYRFLNLSHVILDEIGWKIKEEDELPGKNGEILLFAAQYFRMMFKEGLMNIPV